MKFNLLLFTLCLIPFSSCDNEHKYKHYIFSVIKLQNSVFQSNNVIPAPENTAPYNQYVLRLNLYHLITHDSHFSAYDYTPVCDNPAGSIEITSLTDFNDTKPSGELLNDYFVYYLGDEKAYSLDTIRISAYHLHDPNLTIPETFDLYLTTPPSETSLQRFVVRLNLVAGHHLIDTAEAVTIVQ